MDIKLASINELSNELLTRCKSGIIVLKPRDSHDDGKGIYVNQAGYVYEIVGLANFGSMTVFNDNDREEV